MKTTYSRIVKSVAAAAFAAVLASCEYKFELIGPDAEPKLFLSCMAGDNDSTVVNVGVAQPVSRPMEKYDMEHLKLNLKINGESTDLEMKHTGTWINSPYWVSIPQYKPGDKVEIRAELPGVKPVTASSELPAQIPGGKVFLEKENKKYETYLTLSDIPSECRYLGMKVLRETKVNIEEEIFTNIVEMSVDSDNEIFKEIDTQGSRSNFIFWDRNDVQSDTIRMKLRPDGGIVAEHLNLKYKLILYNLSDELYRYYLSLEATNNGWGADAGLIYRSMYAYSNIDGGFGILGGMTVARTDWFASETETEF